MVYEIGVTFDRQMIYEGGISSHDSTCLNITARRNKKEALLLSETWST
jgi:hypothetical protein